MSELIEKIKGLDKRILIGTGIAIAVVVILIIALNIGGGNKPTNNADTQKGSEIGVQNGTEEFGTESVEGTEILGTEISTEIGTEMESAEVGGQIGTGVTNPSGEEILGGGSASNPYLETPNLDNMTLTTITIPAGQSVYYGIYRVGGMWLEINNPNAYVITSNGTRYDAKNGVVEFKVEDALASDYVLLQIGNKGASEASFTISFLNIKGSHENPEKISSLGAINKTISAGSDKGYMYKYKAEKTGIIRFYFTEWSKNCSMEITNNAVSEQKTFDTIVYTSEPQDGYPEDYAVDEQGRRYIEMSVNAGDEIIIRVSAVLDTKKKYPAVTCTWVAEYK